MKKYLVMVLAVLFLVSTPIGAQDQTVQAADQASQLFVAQVAGDVTVIHQGASHPANPPEPLLKDDRVVTGDDGKAYLEFQNGGTVQVGPDSDMAVQRLETTGPDFKARFLLAWGSFKAKVKKLTTPNSAFEVQAGGVVAGVRGTVFGVDYDKTSQQVSAQTYEGSIFTRSGGKENVLDKGYSAVVQKTGLSIRSPLTGRQANSFKDFVDVSGAIEQKKQEMLQQMHQKIMDKIPVPDSLKNTLGQHLPF